MKSKSVKSLKYMDEFFSVLMHFTTWKLPAIYNCSNCCKIEAVIQRCLAKFTRKPQCQSLFLHKVAASKETREQVFSCERGAILKNTFVYRAPPMTASGKIRSKFLKSAKFQFQLLLTTFDIMGSIYIVTK